MKNSSKNANGDTTHEINDTKPSENCGACSEKVPEDCGIGCDGPCGLWYHIACVNLSQDDYVAINIVADKIKWFCCDCDNSLSLFVQGENPVANMVSVPTEDFAKFDLLLKTVSEIAQENKKLHGKVDKLILDSKNNESINAEVHGSNRPKPIVEEIVFAPWKTMRSSGRGRGLYRPSISPTPCVLDRPTSRLSSDSVSDRQHQYEDADENLKCTNNRQCTTEGLNGPTNENHISRGNDKPRVGLGNGHKTKHYQSPSVHKNKAQMDSRNNTLQPIIGRRKDSALKSVGTQVRPKRKAMFLSRLCPEVGVKDITDLLDNDLALTSVRCTKMKTKYGNYSSFHVEVDESDFDQILSADLWPEGCLIVPFKGSLRRDLVMPDPGDGDFSSTPGGAQTRR